MLIIINIEVILFYSGIDQVLYGRFFLCLMQQGFSYFDHSEAVPLI